MIVLFNPSGNTAAAVPTTTTQAPNFNNVILGASLSDKDILGVRGRICRACCK
jgi:hypothetical protein